MIIAIIIKLSQAYHGLFSNCNSLNNCEILDTYIAIVIINYISIEIVIIIISSLPQCQPTPVCLSEQKMEEGDGTATAESR